MLNHKKIDSKNRKIYQNKDLIKIIYNNYYKKIKKNIYISNKKKILEFFALCFSFNIENAFELISTPNVFAL